LWECASAICDLEIKTVQGGADSTEPKRSERVKYRQILVRYQAFMTTFD
jgi:hypothetical protein